MQYITRSGYQINRISKNWPNVFLISSGDKLLLIDAGTTFFQKRMLRHLNLNLNLNPNLNLNLNYLILTHTHFDHCQNASALKSLYGTKIIVSRAAAPYIQSGFTPIPHGTNTWTKALVWAGERIKPKALTYHPFEADVLVNQQMDLSDEHLNIKIISTPGHSADSISIIVDDEIAIVGDSLFGMFRNSVFPPFADDVPSLYQSWQMLLDTGCHTYLPGHGRAIARETLEHCLKRRCPAI